MAVSPIEDVIEDIKAGKMIILVDDEDRENEGDLTMAAEKITPEAVNFMAKFGRGLICLSLTPEKADALDLPAMVRDNTSRFETAFTVSVEAKHGVTTGISAADRAHFAGHFARERSEVSFEIGQEAFVEDTAGLKLTSVRDLLEVSARTQEPVTRKAVLREVNAVLEAERILAAVDLEAELAGPAVAELDHLAELPGRVHVEQRKRRLRRPEGLPR